MHGGKEGRSHAVPPLRLFDRGGAEGTMSDRTKLSSAVDVIVSCLPRLASSEWRSANLLKMVGLLRRIEKAGHPALSSAAAELATSLQALESRGIPGDNPELERIRRQILMLRRALPEADLASNPGAGNRKRIAAAPRPKPHAATGNSESVEQKMESLRRRYAEQLPSRITHIETAWQRIAGPGQDVDASAEFRRLVHQLRGISGSYGFAELGAAAAEIDDCLHPAGQPVKPTADSRKPWVERQLRKIKRLAAAAAAQACRAEDPAPHAEAAGHRSAGIESAAEKHRQLVFLVEDDVELAQQLSLQIEHFGYRIRAFSTLSGLREALHEDTPDAMIMDVMFPEGDLAGPQAVTEIRKRLKHQVPVIFISARTDLTARLEAVRAQGDAYFAKPLDLEQLLRKLEEITNRGGDPAFRVAVLSQNVEHGGARVARLRGEGIEAHLIAKAENLLVDLPRIQPDLLLLEIDEAGSEGMALAQMLRHQEEYLALPILFTAPKPSPQQEILARKLGEGILPTETNPRVLAAILHRIRTLKNKVRQEVQDEDRMCEFAGVYNHNYLLARLELAQASVTAASGSYSLFCIGIDRVEALRRKFGLRGADQVLRDISQLVLAQADSSDFLALTHFGDLVLLVEGASLEQMKARAESVRLAVDRQIFEVGEQTATVTCSVGVSMFQASGTPEGALREAARARDRARAEGGNRCHMQLTTEQKEKTDVQDREWERRLREAMGRNRFSLLYQPIAVFQGQPQAFCEVLLRLQGSNDELLAPPRFLPNATRLGLDAELDRWVIQRIFHVMRERSGRTENEVRFVVKLSNSSVCDNKLLGWIQKEKAAATIDAAGLTFEIKLDTASRHLREAIELTRGLRGLGFSLLLGDFSGSPEGFRTLEHLRADYLKLSPALIRTLASGPQATSRVSSLVQQAHDMGALVIAPWVEEARLLNTLWGLKIDYVQGFFIQRPSPDCNFSSAEGEAPFFV